MDFRRTGDNLAYDRDSISCAEYQLFVNDERLANRDRSPKRWKKGRFLEGNSSEYVIDVGHEDRMAFCDWLSYRTPYSETSSVTLNDEDEEYSYHFRLSTNEERKQFFDSETIEGGIQLVRFRLPRLFTQLAHELALGRWGEANQETIHVILTTAKRKKEGYLRKEDIDNIPFDHLNILDELWRIHSENRFGFGIQKEIWEQSQRDCIGGSIKAPKDVHELREESRKTLSLAILPSFRFKRKRKDISLNEVYANFARQVGWHDSKDVSLENKLTFSLSAPVGHLPSCISILETSDLLARLEDFNQR